MNAGPSLPKISPLQPAGELLQLPDGSQNQSLQSGRRHRLYPAQLRPALRDRGEGAWEEEIKDSRWVGCKKIAHSNWILMNLLSVLKERIEKIPEGEYTQGLKSVLQHIEVASRHLERGKQTSMKQHTQMPFIAPIKRLRAV
jgi:hypothetical protein